MRILITNDDGINAEGILALAYELQKEHDITVVAPSNQKVPVDIQLQYMNLLW